MTEFELIKKYFAAQALHRPDVMHGIGDDAAIVMPPPHHQLAITTDTLIAGKHFPLDTTADDIGHKSLAVNLSDLAAMGAAPAWVLLAISLPVADENWVNEFCRDFFQLANHYQVQLIGGDLTQSKTLSITVQAIGFIPEGQALLRSTANANDLIYVSGELGSAAFDLLGIAPSLDKLNRPMPQIKLGQALRGIASAAIDISDGLAADLSHILEESQKGAVVNVDALPISNTVRNSLPREKAIDLALTGGDDYELCFTVPPEKQSELEKCLAELNIHCTCIGRMTNQLGLTFNYENGTVHHVTSLGYRHF